jgi:hypothetical protein
MKYLTAGHVAPPAAPTAGHHLAPQLAHSTWPSNGRGIVARLADRRPDLGDEANQGLDAVATLSG